MLEPLVPMKERGVGHRRQKTPWRKRKTIFGEDPRDLEFPLYPAAGYNAVIAPLHGIAFRGAIIQIGNDYPYMLFARKKK